MKNNLLIIAFLLAMFGYTDSWAQSYAVGHTTITFNDPSRSGGYGSGGGPGRQIQSEIYYPASVAGEDVAVANGEFPVIAFGHGFVMSWSSYGNIWRLLVAEGYIVVFPRTEGGISPNHGRFGEDLALCVSKMKALDGDASSIFSGHIGATSALAGHSMGGGAAFLGAANNSDITAVFGLAPAETNPSAIVAAANVSVPTLVLSGSGDAVTRPANDHLPIYNALNSSCKYFVSLTGGGHCNFANANFQCDIGERFSFGRVRLSRRVQQEITADYLVDWLDAKLKNDAGAESAFNSLLASDSRTTFEDGCQGNSRVATVSKAINSELTEKQKAIAEITAFPNPMTKKVTIKLPSEREETSVVMFNASGQALFSKLYMNKQEISIELDDMKPGVYFFQVKSDGESQLLRVVKK